MPVRKMQDVDRFSGRFWNDGGRRRLGCEIETFVYFDGWWDCTRILQPVQSQLKTDLHTILTH